MRLIALSLCLFSLAVAPAQSPKRDASRISTNLPSSQPGSANNQLLSQDQVDNWIRLWQKRLSLENWKIESKIVRSWELPENAVANIHWSIPNGRATIKVLNAVDSTLKKSEILEDTELSVVHELIHLSLAKLPLDPNHTDLEEETVKKISTALLGLDKKK